MYWQNSMHLFVVWFILGEYEPKCVDQMVLSVDFDIVISSFLQGSGLRATLANSLKRDPLKSFRNALQKVLEAPVCNTIFRFQLRLNLFFHVGPTCQCLGIESVFYSHFLHFSVAAIRHHHAGPCIMAVIVPHTDAKI